MKRLFYSIFLIFSVLIIMVVPATAKEINSEAVDSVITEYDDGTVIISYDDGSSITISPINNLRKNDFVRSESQVVSGSKDATFKDSSGNIKWKYTLSGVFSYEYGVSSLCTSATYTKNIYDNNWTFSNGSAYPSNNKAVGIGKFELKILSITIKTYNIDINITCDKFGNLS